MAAGTGVDFVDADQIGVLAQDAGLDQATTAAIVDDYEAAQLQALKAGLLAAAALAFVSLASTGGLPRRVEDGPSPDQPSTAEPTPGTTADT